MTRRALARSLAIATVLVVADASLSTRCGARGVSIAGLVARAIATIGMSAVFFQDMFGLATFDDACQHLAAIRPRIGRNQVMHCMDAYQNNRGLQEVKGTGSMSMTIGSFMRKTSLIPFVSDFLFDEPRALDLLATRLVDTQVGIDFFNDPLRMHRDLLSDAAQDYLPILIDKP